MVVALEVVLNAWLRMLGLPNFAMALLGVLQHLVNIL
jgi:hypothetical protein